MTHEQIRFCIPVIAFIMKQNLVKETFQISIPDIKNQKEMYLGTVLVKFGKTFHK